MPAHVRRWSGSPPPRARIVDQFAGDGLIPSSWANAAGDRYGWHAHAYHKVLYCVSGSIAFHTREGDFDLGPGDRLDIPPGTEHAATVGPGGVECMEAPKEET